MHAMILEKPGTALQHREVATPAPSIGQVKVRVLACAVCRTDLHVVDDWSEESAAPLGLLAGRRPQEHRKMRS